MVGRAPLSTFPATTTQARRCIGEIERGGRQGTCTVGLCASHGANAGELGVERRGELVASIRTRSAEEIGKEVLTRVTEWGPGEQDDRTVVIVKAVSP